MIQDHELDQYGAEHLRALLTAAVDDLLRLAASVLGGGDGGAADAESLRYTWAWSDDANTYSDGTCIVATATTTHIWGAAPVTPLEFAQRERFGGAG